MSSAGKRKGQGNRGRGGKRGRGKSIAGNISFHKQPDKSIQELKDLLMNECTSLG